jgi:hypothetical protein
MAVPSTFLAEMSVDIRLSDNLLNHACIAYGIGPQPACADRHRARFPLALDRDLEGQLEQSGVRADPAACVISRRLALSGDNPSADGLRRALTQPRISLSGGRIAMRVGRAVLHLDAQALDLVWRACEQLHDAHYRQHWQARQPQLAALMEDLQDRLCGADIPHRLAELTAREPSRAEIGVYLLDSDALISYSGPDDRICISLAALSRFERFIYLGARECALLLLHNPPWWEVEPCASACAGLSDQLLDAVETCTTHYLAATVALRHGADPGCWMVDPAVEEIVARLWPQFVAAGRGVDLLLERTLRELRQRCAARGQYAHAAPVRPRRLSVTYDDTGRPLRCCVASQRF